MTFEFLICQALYLFTKSSYLEVAGSYRFENLLKTVVKPVVAVLHYQQLDRIRNEQIAARPNLF